MVDLRKEKGLKTRELILLTALEILFQEGKVGLTTRNLAEKAGVSKGNIYHHFKNMDMILEEAFKYELKSNVKSMLDFKYHDLNSLIENFVINILDVFKKKDNLCETSHDPFLELISTNDKLLHFLEDMEDNMKLWIKTSIGQFIEKELSAELDSYLTDVMSLFIEGARTNIFFMKKDITSYKKSWKILSKHLVEKILEEIK